MSWTALAVAARQASDAAVDNPMDSLFGIVRAGGVIMIPIGIASVAGLAYTIERLIRMRRKKVGTADFSERVVKAVEEGGPERGIQLCEAEPSHLANVVRAGLAEARHSFLHMEKAGEDAGAKEVRHLMNNLRPFLVVATIAPLLGLLGTVWGMIIAFMQIAYAGGLGKPEQLANGIAQALITTAAGLIVAIPIQVVYYYFRARVDRFVILTEQTYGKLAEKVRTKGAPHANA
ncbi:MAG: MotA/TolQ/ExbB proton channel family protein [Planctomycetota bacterium]|nr:MAG: MotA/TolQ/ExbB proton channel family protein [Planctomycetota bacterium]